MVGGGDPFYLKFWVNRPPWSEIADFEPIIARSALAVTASEKSSININRKSTTRFPMSLVPKMIIVRCPQGFGADYVTVVENRHTMYCLHNIIWPFWPKLTHPAVRSLR